MKNLTVPKDLNWHEEEVEIPVQEAKVHEEYTGVEFKLGDRILPTKQIGIGGGSKYITMDEVGVIFKTLDNFNFWVAFPGRENRLEHLPCHFDVLNRKEMVLEMNNN